MSAPAGRSGTARSLSGGSISTTRRARSEQQKEKSFIYFEQLVDEMVKLCPLESRAGICRVELWKTRRRAWLAREYRHYMKLIRYVAAAMFMHVRYRFLACREA